MSIEIAKIKQIIILFFSKLLSMCRIVPKLSFMFHSDLSNLVLTFFPQKKPRGNAQANSCSFDVRVLTQLVNILKSFLSKVHYF